MTHLAYLADSGNPFLSRGSGMLYKALRIGGLANNYIKPLANGVDGAKAILALGPRSATALTGQLVNVDSMSKRRGYVYWNEQYQLPVIPTFDPDYIRMGRTGLLQALIYDLKVSPFKPLPTIPYQYLTLHPIPSDLESFINTALNSNFGICDIETPYSIKENLEDEEDLEEDPSSTILRVSLGYIHEDTTYSITFPFTDGYKIHLQTFLSKMPHVIFWNGDYDIPRLELNLCPIGGVIVDAMWLFHFLYPDLPRSLASAASFYTDLPEWKSLSSTQEELYNALDSYATGLSFIGVRRHLVQKGMWQTAWDHVVKLQQVLRKMRHRGLMVSTSKLEVFRQYLTTEIDQLQVTLNETVPLEVRPTHVVSAKHLRGRCSCLTPRIGRSGKLTKQLVPLSTCLTCTGTGWLPPIVNILNFNAGSSEQVKTLIRALGHKVPVVKVKGKKDRESTNKLFLDDLSNQHQNAPYKYIAEQRKLSKMRDTYTEWPLKPSPFTGLKVAATKLTLIPSTGRLSSVNPNMQNIPKEGKLADEFKKCLVARPGHIILKRDYSGIEAVLTGYFSKDPEYMRLALLGVHTYRCAQYFNEAPSLEVSDSMLGAALKTLKKKYDHLQSGEQTSIYQRFKKINHMGNYKAGPKKIFDSSPGVFADLKEVKKLHKFMCDQSPLRSKWWESIEYRCNTQYCIITPYNYIRWFWDMPADLTKAVAMEPQSTAAAIIKESMLLVDESEAGPYMVLQVHDEIVSDFPIAPGSCTCCPGNTRTWQEYDEIVRAIMERPLTNLNNLVILTEASSGDSYACK